MKIALTTDHAGLEKTRELQSFLESKGFECIYMGPASFVSDDDYPDFISPTAEFVASGHADMAIIMGGSGHGEAMCANRFKGIRCATYYGPAAAAEAIDASGAVSTDAFDIVRLSRQHNNANMLSIGARFVSTEAIHTVVELWVSTPFSGLERHVRRINKLDLFGA